MKKILGPFLLLFSVFVFAETSEYSYDDLLAIDSTINEQLTQIGFEGNPEEIILVVDKDEENQRLEFSIKHREPNFPQDKSNKDTKNLFAAGAVFSYAYLQGFEVSYLHYKPSKDKINFHMDASISGTPSMNNLRLSFDPHIGKWGLFLGVNAQLIGVKSKLLPNTPRTNIYAGGAEIGWQKIWGKQGKLVTTVKLGVMGTQYEYNNFYMPEASFSIKYIPFRKKNKH